MIFSFVLSLALTEHRKRLRPTRLKEKASSVESGTHSEEQGGDGRAALHVDHGQQAGEVALSGSGEEQPVRGRDAMGGEKNQMMHTHSI